MKQNVLNRTRCYLAGNLENTADPDGWRHMVSERLKPRGVTLFSPIGQCFVDSPFEDDAFRASITGEAYANNPEYVYETMSKIVAQDLRLIDLSDYVITNLEVRKPTFGTIHELVVATQQKKPLFLCIPSKKDVPRWLAGLIKPAYIYETLEEILTTLESIDEGRIKVDSNNWRLLVPELR